MDLLCVPAYFVMLYYLYIFKLHKKEKQRLCYFYYFRTEKIKFIQDQSVKDEQLLLAKDDPIMQEVCEFDILIINETYKEISQNKTMSIYEALKFVKHTMEHIKAF